MLRKVAGIVVALVLLVAVLWCATHRDLQLWAMTATAFGGIFIAFGIFAWSFGVKVDRFMLGLAVIGAVLLIAA